MDVIVFQLGADGQTVQVVAAVVQAGRYLHHCAFAAQHAQVNGQLQTDQTAAQQHHVLSGFFRVIVNLFGAEHIGQIDAGKIGLDGAST